MSLSQLLLVCSLAIAAGAAAAPTVVVVEGLGGNERYVREFATQVEAITAAAATMSPAPDVQVYRAGASRDDILQGFAALIDTTTRDDPFVVYLVGHGSYDDHEYKFNIAGPDLNDADIRNVLEAVPSATQVLINTSSASGAAGEMWQADNRVVVTATRSGVERHATRFGMRFAAALANAAADIDKNDIVTVQEAFDFADQSVRDFFASNGQLATEHALLLGARAERIGLARLDAARPSSNDTELVRLATAREAANAKIEQLRVARDELPAEDYENRLFSAMLELAEIEEAIEQREAELDRAQ